MGRYERTRYDRAVESGTFDVQDFADELAGAPNYDVGTRLLFANDRVKVWEIVLDPGERTRFHRHVHPYFFVGGSSGRVRTRLDNGFYVEDDTEPGEFMFLEHSDEEPGVHDLENIGRTTIRYTTVELLGG
jgi:hypothetical protein